MHRLRFTAWFEDPAIGAMYDVLLYERKISPMYIDYLWNYVVQPVVLSQFSLAGPVVQYRFQFAEEEDV